MLKARHILTIFLLNYLLILIACSLMEFFQLSNNAQQIEIMMRTAADMALDQMQATDDFFVTGGGYFKADASGEINGSTLGQVNYSPYHMAVIDNSNNIKRVNIFSSFAKMKGVSSTNLEDIYNVVYPESDIKQFINENPDVLNLKYLVGNMDISYITDLGTYQEKKDKGEALSGLDMGSERTQLKLGWYMVPKIANIGLASSDASISNEIKNVSGASASPLSKSNIIKTYELNKRIKEFETGIKYAITPLNQGITYINEELLQVFYMNNMQLLMRAKYANASNRLPNGYAGGVGMFKGDTYQDLVDDSTLSQYHPIHNGSYTLLMGEGRNCGDGVTLYEGLSGRLPKVEYVVVDMYQNTEANNRFLKQVLGAKINTTNFVGIGGSGSGTLTYGTLINTNGQSLKELNKEEIRYYSDITGVSAPFEHKYMVVAKVTFYGDFIVPYTTVGLREMRARMESNNDKDIGGRYLFNPFSEYADDINRYNAANGQKLANKENYVDLVTEVKDVNKSNSVLSNLMSGFGHLGGVTSDPMVYTTYFAVTP